MGREGERQGYRKILQFPQKRNRRISRKPARSRFFIGLLLTGKVWDRRALFDAVNAAYPEGSVMHAHRMIQTYLPVVDDLGALEHVGRYSFRIKPDILPLLREGGFCGSE